LQVSYCSDVSTEILDKDTKFIRGNAYMAQVYITYKVISVATVPVKNAVKIAFLFGYSNL
jgi:hypothetical protein